MTSQAANHPAPFSFEYGFSGGSIPFTIKATRSLKQIAPNVWQTELTAKNLLGQITETSKFSWNGCIPVTAEYTNYRKGLGQTREAHLVVERSNAQPKAIVSRSKKDNREFDVTAHSTDMLSLPLAIQCQLKQNPHAKLSYEVASERRHESYDFVIKGTQKVTTPAGDFSAIRVERDRNEEAKRHTIMWFSEEHDFALVKMVQDDGKSTYEMNLRSF